MNIYEKLAEIQHELKAPKGQYNSFGKYKYRSCEDILEAVKPICYKHKAVLTLTDDVIAVGDRIYIKAKATLYDTEATYKENTDKFECGKVENTAYARESFEKKGMDDSQITGTASSYARKYALNGLFNIDDTKDADTDEFTGNQVIDKTKVKALEMAISNRGISSDTVCSILTNHGYESLKDIKVADYKKICDELSKEAK